MCSSYFCFYYARTRTIHLFFFADLFAWHSLNLSESLPYSSLGGVKISSRRHSVTKNWECYVLFPVYVESIKAFLYCSANYRLMKITYFSFFSFSAPANFISRGFEMSSRQNLWGLELKSKFWDIFFWRGICSFYLFFNLLAFSKYNYLSHRLNNISNSMCKGLVWYWLGSNLQL